MNSLQQQGRLAYKRGDYTKAIGYFDRALSKDSSVQLLDNRASCYEKLGQLSTALKDAKAAIQLCREDATGYLRAGKILVRMEKPKVALEVYARGLRCIKHIGKGYEILQKHHSTLMEKTNARTGRDPLEILPPELARMIFDFLPFKARVKACLVSKQWARFVRSSPHFWQHLDLTGGRRTVPKAFVTRAINCGRNKVTSVRLGGLSDLESALEALVRHFSLENVFLDQVCYHEHQLVDILARSTSLKSICASATAGVSNVFLPVIWSLLSQQLERLECSIGGDRRTRWPHHLGTNLRVLALRFDSPKSIPDNGLIFTSEQLPVLESFSLSVGWPSIGDSYPIEIKFEGHQTLREVSIDFGVKDAPQLGFPPTLVSLSLKRAVFGSPRPNVIGTWNLPTLQNLKLDSQDLLMIHPLLGDPTTTEGSSLAELALSHPLRSQEGSGGYEYWLGHPRLLHVRHLSLAGAYDLDDSQLSRIADLLKDLKSMDISGTSVTGVGIKNLLTTRSIEYLDVSNCYKLGADAVDWARSQGTLVVYRLTLESTTKCSKVNY